MFSSVTSNNCKVFVHYGGMSMSAIPDVTMNGNTYFGYSISCANDVNNDGYDDIIVGEYFYSSYTGKAYIYFGGNSMDNISDIVMTGQNSGDYFGASVSGLNDINNDGFNDVISGAAESNTFGTSTGASYVFLSSPPSIKPALNRVSDVPFDQGGKLNLKWTRSAYDVTGINKITDYYIEMSDPPSGGNFYWIPAGTVTATKNQFYACNITTPYDSSSNTSGTFYFRITARTSNPSEFWRSNVMSGRSADNIAPLLVSPFNAFSENVNVRLTWKRSAAPDLLNYVLFRSASASIDPYTATPLSTVTDSTFLDTSPLNGSYYYFIVAQDIHNNLSPVASTQSPVNSKKLFLFGAIQGLYDAAANTMIYDTVTVYLRNAVSPFAKIDSSKKELYGPGTGQEFFFSNIQNNIPYYVEVKHRNALETWSANAVTFVNDDASIAFSVDASYAFGNNEIQVDSNPYNVFAFYSGDVNQDGYIDLTDMNLIFNAASNFVSGYVVTDLTGDNIVDLTDLTMTFNNSSGFVSVVKP